MHDLYYRSIATIPLLSKLVERVVTDLLQAFLEEMDSLDLFQSEFRPWNGTEVAMITLEDYLLRQTNRRSVTLLVLMDLFLVFFETVNNGILLSWLRWEGVPSFSGSSPSSRANQMAQLGEAVFSPLEISVMGFLRDHPFTQCCMNPLGEFWSSLSSICGWHTALTLLCFIWIWCCTGPWVLFSIDNRVDKGQ